jgi:hypothetical protein
VRRIVVMQQSTSREEAFLRAVADAAARMNKEIAGLFIEDIDLLNLAGMPFPSEICFPSATRREMDVSRLERSLRLLANQARQALESVAQRTSLQSSFRVARGSIFAELLAAASESDVVVAGSLSRARTIPALTVVCLASVAPASVADLLNDLAPRLRGNITVVLLERGDTAADNWERELRRALSTKTLSGPVRVVCPADELELEKVLRA